MKKIIVIGCCGSGKSYFSLALSQKLNIPIYHMDILFWRENWTHVDKEELRRELAEIYPKENWIIDGNYIGTLEERFKAADTIFFLDVSEELCLESEEKRRGKPRPDLPSYLKEEYDPEFINFIKSFKTEDRPVILSLLEKYKNKEIHIFKTRDEVNKYLEII